MQAAQSGRQYWLWVTGPDYYLDENGEERRDLDPAAAEDTDGWWTCHKETQIGDLIFLWRTLPKSDIGYLLEARSPAYYIGDEPGAAGKSKGWQYGCEYRSLYKFQHPVTIKDIKADPALYDWPALRDSFQGTRFRITLDYWQELNRLAISKGNPRYAEFLAYIAGATPYDTVNKEIELEEKLVHHLALLKPFGYDLHLYTDPVTGKSGRQFICKGNGGIIDLLCYDAAGQQYVVIELKNVLAGQNTFAQICNYVGWAQQHIAAGTPVKGLVISRGADAKFLSCQKITDRIQYLDLKQLGLS